MAGSVDIPFWPTSLECLDWSEDNNIAVTGGEAITVVSPRLQELGPNETCWDTTTFHVNGFTEAELPFCNLLTNANYSIGEELSSRQALAAKWSYPALAQHKRCALAVLTANHVLSVWAVDGNPTDASKWKRELIINNAVREYYDSREEQNTRANEQDRQHQERRQIQQRILAFSWGSPLCELTEDGCDIACVDWGAHLIAVATGAGDILFVHVLSPFGSFMGHPEWTAKVTGGFNVMDRSVNATDDLSGIDSAYQSRNADQTKETCVANCVSWSKWNPQHLSSGCEFYALLAYITNGKLFTTVVHGSFADDRVHCDVIKPNIDTQYLKDSSPLKGPLCFLPGGTPSSIVAFGMDRVYITMLNNGPPPANGAQSHHLDGRWDEICGLAFTYAGRGEISLHLASQLSSATATTSTLNASSLQAPDGMSGPNSWQYAIQTSKASFGAEFDLGGKVQERTWGIASSPRGDYVATCVSMHPSDCIAYVIGSEQKSTLNITHETEPSSGCFLPISNVVQGSASEMILFGLQRNLPRSSLGSHSGTLDKDLIIPEILRSMQFSQTNAYFQDSRAIIAVDAESSPNKLLRYVRLVLFAHPDMRTARAARLLAVAIDKASRRKVTREVIQQLVNLSLCLPMNAIEMDDLSRRIIKVHGTIYSKLDAQSHVDIPNSSNVSVTEDCKICDQVIPFESVHWARCRLGHQFSRCALTFLAVQEPGVTKACSICGLLYLKEIQQLDSQCDTDTDIEMTEVPNDEGSSFAASSNIWIDISLAQNSSMLRKPTLAQLLFAACDTCIYCGGKFVQ